jgi:uncharacterized membrane protein YdjX (TVP38/TMEM64 family)
MRLPFTKIQVTPKQIALGVAVLVVLLGMSVGYHYIDMPALHARAQRLSGPMVLGLLAVLPLVGFPVTLLHVVAGVRFGPWLGLAAVAGATLFHLTASYLLVKAVPHFFAPKLEAIRQRIPRGAHGPVTLFTLLLPGAPYWAINYVLPLISVRFWVFMGIAFPMHVARSTISIYFGDASDHLTPARLAVVAGYWAVILPSCALSYRWLRQRLKDPPPTANGRKRPASAGSAGPKPAAAGARSK